MCLRDVCEYLSGHNSQKSLFARLCILRGGKNNKVSKVVFFTNWCLNSDKSLMELTKKYQYTISKHFYDDYYHSFFLSLN
jgi:hypothetical protein